MKKYFLFASVLFIFAGCGGGDAYNEEGNIELYNVGIFFDTEVAGLDYKCGDNKGVTDENGSFEYSQEDVCEFYLGSNTFDVNVASSEDGIVTPFDLVETDAEAIELARTIQSLSTEEDGVLKLDRVISAKLEKLDLKDSNATKKAIKKTGSKLVGLENAIAHLSKNFNLDDKNSRAKIKPEALSRVKEKKEKIKVAKDKRAKAKKEKLAKDKMDKEEKDKMDKKKGKKE